MRQSERRELFEKALATMPRWETWTTEDWNVPPRTVATNHYQTALTEVVKTVEVEPPRKRQHCKLIPRRVRRDMARQLAKRQWEATHPKDNPAE